MATSLQDDLVVLASIYGDDFVSDGIGDDGVTRFRVRLRSSSNDACSIQVAFDVPAAYPTKAPRARVSSAALDAKQTEALQIRAGRFMKERAKSSEPTLYDALLLLQEELGRMHDGQAAPSAFEAYTDARAAKTTAALAEEAHKAQVQDEEERRNLAQLRDRVHAAARAAIVHDSAPPAAPPPEPACPIADAEDAVPVQLTSQRGFSRFQSDFVDQVSIGAGGFGSVMRVKNRVDGLTYAVKVVVLSDDPGENRKLLREVSTLSVLNHPNVVRYYQAWIEESYESRRSGESDTGSESTPALTSEVSGTLPLRHASAGRRQGAAPDWMRADTSHSDRLHARNRRKSHAKRGGVRPSPVVEAATPSTPTSPPAITLPPRHATAVEDNDDSSSWASTREGDREGDGGDETATTDSDDEDDAPARAAASRDDSDTDDVLAGLHGGLQLDELVGGPVRRGNRTPALPRSYPIHALATPSSDLFDRGEGMEPSSYSSDFAPAAKSGVPSARVRVRRLYIQMEYCQSTLRALIDRSLSQSGGGLPLAERWKVTRQLLDALAYIHGRGILHRDIKPANILLDAEGNVKLGDFGLAVDQQFRGRSAPPPGADAVTSAVSESLAQLGASISAGVGTTLYRAPEVATGVKYDAKADMFSLGVVLFELFFRPLSTGMERSVVIMRLREHEGRDTGWPAGYADAVPAGARTLISMLLHMDAKLRPTTEDVLNMSLLPDRGEVETRYMDEAARALTQPHSAFMEKLLKRIFARPTQDFVDMSFDADAAETRLHVAPDAALLDSGMTPFDSLPYILEASAVSAVRKMIAAVCERHGAVAFDVPSLLPRPAVLAGYAGIALRRIGAIAILHADFGALLPELAMLLSPAGRGGGASSAMTAQLLSHFAHALSSLSAPAFSPIGMSTHASDTARQSALLVDRGGVIVQLPHDSAHVFARWLARAHVHAFKRYTITRVYRPREAGKQPREVTEAALDIVSPCPTTSPLQSWIASGAVDAETIFTACEVCVASQGGPSASATASSAYFVRVNNSKIVSGLCDLLCLSSNAASILSRLVTACAALTQALEGHDASAKGHSRAKSSALKHATATASSERLRDGVLSWPDIRAYVVVALDVSQHTADLLRPILLPAAAGMDSMLAGVEEMLKRQRSPLLKRLAESLSSHTPAAAAGSDDKQVLCRQLRGMLLMYQGVAELTAMRRYMQAYSLPDASALASRLSSDTSLLRMDVDGSGLAGSAASAAATMDRRRASGLTGEVAAAGSGAALRADLASALQSGGGLILDLGLTDPDRYHGTTFQLILQPWAKMAANLLRSGVRTSMRAPAAAPAASAVPLEDRLTMETLLKTGSAFETACERECIARGGRYDDLVLKYRVELEDRAPPPLVAQVRFGVEKLAHAAQAMAAAGTHSVTLPTSAPGYSGFQITTGDHTLAMRCMQPVSDILVCALGDATHATVMERAGIASALWSAGVAAEYMHPLMSDFADCVKYACGMSVKVIVLLKDWPAAAPTAGAAAAARDVRRIRVRDVFGRDDVEVNAADVVSPVQRILHSLMATAATASLATPDASAAPTSVHIKVHVMATGSMEDTAGAAKRKHAKDSALEKRVHARLAQTSILAGVGSPARGSAGPVTVHVLAAALEWKWMREAGSAYVAGVSPADAAVALQIGTDASTSTPTASAARKESVKTVDAARVRRGVKELVQALLEVQDRVAGAPPIVLYSDTDDRFDVLYV